MRRIVVSAFALIALAVLAAESQVVYGAEVARQRVSLAKALEIAAQHNRAVKAANLRREAVSQATGEARGAMLPRLDATENFSNTNNPPAVFSNLLSQQDFTKNNFDVDKLNSPSPLSNFQTQIRLTQQIFAGGKLLAAFEAAKDSSEAERWRALRQGQEVAFAVIGAYYTAILAGKQLEVIDRALDSARAHREQASDLFSRGMVVKSDLLRSGVAVGTWEQERIQGENRLHISWASLAHMLGIEDQPVAPLENPEELDAARRRVATSMADVISIALGRRPELHVADAEVGRACQQVRIAEADYLPSVSVGAAYENDSEHFSRAGNSYSVFVAGQLNLFNGLATRSKTESARAELMRAEVLKEDLKHAIALEVETAYRGLSAALDRLKVAERDTAYAAEALAIIKDRYSSGLATNLEVLDAETSNAQAQTRSIEARVGVQIAAAALALASGAMPGDGGGW
jgi:outer membrane protein